MGGFIGFGKQHHAETHYGSETSKDTKEHEGRTVILRPGFAEESPAMPQTHMRYPGSSARILVKSQDRA